MGPSAFLVVCLVFVALGFQRRLTGLALRPAVLNLPAIFSLLFLVYYAQYYFIAEVVFGEPVSHWLTMADREKTSATLFLIGYLVAFWIGVFLYPRRSTAAQDQTPINYSAIGVTLGLATLGAFVVYVQITGGFASFVTNHRQAVYQDQWSRTAEAIAFTRMRMITSGIMMAAAIVGGYFAGVHDTAKPWQRWLYHLLPLPATLVKIALLSRGFFLMYAIFFLAKTVSSRRRQRYLGLKMAAMFLLVMAGVTSALVLRSDGDPTFSDPAQWLYFTARSVNGMSGFLDSYAVAAYGGGEGLPRVLRELSPVPSFIYSSPYDNNLTTLVLGAAAGSSAPMPFIGEAYYNLGWFALTLAMVQGYLAALVNQRIAIVTGRDKVWWLLLYITTIYSFLYLPHSGLRSCTRLIVWVLLLFAAKRLLVLLSRKKSRSGPVHWAEPGERRT